MVFVVGVNDNVIAVFLKGVKLFLEVVDVSKKEVYSKIASRMTWQSVVAWRIALSLSNA